MVSTTQSSLLRRSSRYGLSLAAALLLWWLVARLLGPGAVRSSFEHPDLPLIGRLIAGRDAPPVGDYLVRWSALARWVGVTLAHLRLAMYPVLVCLWLERDIEGPP